MEAVTDFLFLGSKLLCMVTAAMKLKVSFLEGHDKPRQFIKKRRHHFADKGLCSQSSGLSSTHVWMSRVGP